MADMYDEMTSGYDEVEASQGRTGEPLPNGWYFLKVAKVLETGKSRDYGIPYARVQVQVTRGLEEGRVAFLSMSMGVKPVDSKGNTRDAAAMKKSNDTQKGIMKMWMKAIKVDTATPVGEDEHKVLSFYNVGAWEGREFIGKLKSRPATDQFPASNQLDAARPLDDVEHGEAFVTKWQSDKLARKVATGTSTPGASGAQTI